MTHKILLVDNEELSRASVKKALRKDDLEVIEVECLGDADRLVEGGSFGLILLGGHFLAAQRLEFIAKLKHDRHHSDCRLVLLVGRDEVEYTVLGLRAGADDYLSRPFTSKALSLRVKIWLNEALMPGDHNELHFDALCMDEISHLTTIDGNPVRLGPTEFRLLNFFMRHPNQAFRRKELISQVWKDPDVDQRTVDVHIRRLRKALVPYGYDAYLQTVRTIGYRFSNYGISIQRNMN